MGLRLCCEVSTTTLIRGSLLNGLSAYFQNQDLRLGGLNEDGSKRKVSIDHTFSVHQQKYNKGEVSKSHSHFKGQALGMICQDTGVGTLQLVPNLTIITTKWGN